MTYLEILELIEKEYKDGEDWIYQKGKQQEIKIIKHLLSLHEGLRDYVIAVEDELEIMLEKDT